MTIIIQYFSECVYCVGTLVGLGLLSLKIFDIPYIMTEITQVCAVRTTLPHYKHLGQQLLHKGLGGHHTPSRVGTNNHR